ncbi:MAG: ABC transporter permease [Bacteroidia bacterium]|nr:ABC transporter permease [Bacteroidia bacterium]
MQFYLTALILALSMACLGWGVFISLKISGFPDITTDGSYTLGAAVLAVCLDSGLHWGIGMVLALFSGLLAGGLTGLMHTRLKVQALLSGILMMTALYSVNLMIMGRSNIPLDDSQTFFGELNLFENTYFSQAVLLLFVCLVIGKGLHWYLQTDSGIALRATGNAAVMARSMGVNTSLYQTGALALSNGLTALSGALVAQVQLFADINMGIGIVIFGLGAVMIGDSLNGSKRTGTGRQIIAVLAGCLIFRLIIAFSLQIGADPVWLRLITSAVVLIFVALPAIRQHRRL